MNLPIAIPFFPMEAKSASKIPVGENWEYEPKWDGFRCLAFRSGSEVELQSKAGQPLTRYFPEIAAALLEVKAKKFVLDGELILPVDGRLSFDDLLQRIHPAASRVQMLSQKHPARLVVFDLLVDEKVRRWYRGLWKNAAKYSKHFTRDTRLTIKPLNFRWRLAMPLSRRDG